MSKNIKDVCFIVQARLSSQRVPNKMLRPFGNSNLFEILLKKLTSKYSNIPINQLYTSVYEKELKQISYKLGATVFDRSCKSANSDCGIQTLFEWYNKLPYKYVILISACNPFLSIDTINNFIQHYLMYDTNGLFGVTKHKNYYWNTSNKMLNEWPTDQDLLNTKAVDVTYEAAHCLYASRMDSIGKGQWVGNWKTGKDIEFFPINEFESLDIDYEWQFQLYDSFYKKYEKNQMIIDKEILHCKHCDNLPVITKVNSKQYNLKHTCNKWHRNYYIYHANMEYLKLIWNRRNVK